ncbi:hypothetical protein BC834DRAFT_1014011 [Gloeopeniophorella convolvens]|nr:hypothetical protein BC834DRAFT_1014011 [Gloeopeniophorella convolvens]
MDFGLMTCHAFEKRPDMMEPSIRTIYHQSSSSLAQAVLHARPSECRRTSDSPLLNTVGGIFITPVEELAYAYLPAISYVLSDAIVVWRAWVLWERRYELLIPPILFMLGTIAVSVADANITFKSPTTDTWQEVQISDRLGYCIWGFTILTNLWATGLICIKTWQHRRFIRSLMGKSTQRTRAEKALAFLIESSSIYLCIWITWVTVNVTSHPNSIGGLLVFYPVIVQIIGIYPTVIVVVVTMRLSTADVLSRHGRSEQLAPPVFVSRSLEPASSYGSTSDTDNTARTYTSIHLQMKDQSSN